MSKESIEGPLTALRNAGTVCGVCLARDTEVVVNLFPFSAKRVEEMITVIDDILLHFQKSGRNVDQMCFGYDGGNLVIVIDEDYRLIVMHMHPDEIDFIAKAARAFLVDFQVGLFAERLAGQDVRLPEITNGVRIEPVRNEPPPGEASLPEVSGSIPTREAAKVETTPIPIPAGGETETEAVTSGAEETPVPPRPRPILPPPPSKPPATATAAPADASGGAGEEAGGEEDEDVQRPRLAPNQPASTLPPPRVPKPRE